MIKQKGAMLAKGWLLGIQFEELFQHHLFYELASHANTMAQKLRTALTDCGYFFAYNSQTNQLFPIFPDTVIEKLAKNFTFNLGQRIDETHSSIRLVTSWATTDEGVEEFIQTLKAITD